MDVEGEIQDGGADRQNPKFPGRSKHEDLLRRGLRKFIRIHLVDMFEVVPHRSQPLVEAFLVADTLVGPVRCLPFFCLLVHPRGADLHLHRSAKLVLHRDVQGLVTIRLGGRHPIPQTTRIGFIFLSHPRIHLPAQVLFDLGIRLAIDDEAYREHIVHPFERHFLMLHLPPDGIGRFCPRLQYVADPVLGKRLLQRFHELQREPFPVLLRSLELVGDRPVLLRFGKPEIDVLHLALDVVESQLMGKRDVQHQRLQNLVLARLFRENLKIPHDLQPVGDLQNRDPGIPGILDNELLVFLGFQTRILGTDRRNLVQPVDHRVHILGKTAELDRPLPVRPLPVEFSLPQVDFRVLPGRLMQEHGRHAIRRKADFIRHDQRHVERMLDERASIAAGLFLQYFRRNLAGPPDQVLSDLVILRESVFNGVHIPKSSLYKYKIYSPEHQEVWLNLLHPDCPRTRGEARLPNNS